MDLLKQIKKKSGKFSRGIRSAFSTRKRIFASVSLALIVFVLMNLAARPFFSLEMISADIFLIPEAVMIVFLYNSPNQLQMFFALVYAFLSGPALVLMYLQFTSFGSGAKDIVSIVPGLVASGCVGCGAGVIGLLGLTGAIAALPFNGQLITPAAVLLLIYFITKSGNPEICSLEH